jgi:hypothetical protein
MDRNRAALDTVFDVFGKDSDDGALALIDEFHKKLSGRGYFVVPINAGVLLAAVIWRGLAEPHVLRKWIEDLGLARVEPFDPSAYVTSEDALPGEPFLRYSDELRELLAMMTPHVPPPPGERH